MHRTQVLGLTVVRLMVKPYIVFHRVVPVVANPRVGGSNKQIGMWEHAGCASRKFVQFREANSLSRYQKFKRPDGRFFMYKVCKNSCFRFRCIDSRCCGRLAASRLIIILSYFFPCFGISILLGVNSRARDFLILLFCAERNVHFYA